MVAFCLMKKKNSIWKTIIRITTFIQRVSYTFKMDAIAIAITATKMKNFWFKLLNSFEYRLETQSALRWNKTKAAISKNQRRFKPKKSPYA